MNVSETSVIVPNQSAVLPLPAHLDPTINTPVWYEAECNALDIVNEALTTIRKQMAKQPLTPQEAKAVMQMAEIAHRARTGQSRLDAPDAGKTLNVVFLPAPTRDTLPRESPE